jgi:arylsulfatase A-like enzyme
MGHIHSRRTFLKTSGMAALSLAALSSCQKKAPMNVLFIGIDDLNDWVGCLGGHPQVKTPNIDRLAERGVLLTNAHCAAPACNPSRAALFTGIRPSTSGVYHNPQPWRQSPALKDAVTIPQHFRAHGYKAIGSGKMYHDSFPDPVSWNAYWPSLDQQRPEDPMPPQKKWPLNGFPHGSHFDWGPIDNLPEEMGDWQVGNYVIGELRKSHEKPFFLACGFFRPHLPWYAPQKYFDLYPLDSIILPEVKENDLDDVPEYGRRIARQQDHKNVLKYDQWKKAVRGYLASISFVDACLGRVIDALDQSAYRDNTVIVLWSDHGWHLGEKLHWRKFALWEEATHNVLFFSAPGVTPAGGRTDAPVNLLDIYPTLIELCNLSPRDDLEGISLMPLLKDPNCKWGRPTVTTHGKNNHSVRSRQYRYIRYEDGSEELYDHESDPMEWTNLADDLDYLQIKDEMAAWLPEINVDEIASVRE